ncbi:MULTISPECIES: gliding motility-associated ABC transporter permease subunit GldF [unclassified Siphonobacter]|uniref:gliding motility-associated ABC transporter permease subunit GldF n=1 Tax=unclassified Siphonobacter TaxID=2635712 RepID=UPI000CB7C9CD|nr:MULTISPECIES: gliding motility-associated ABC transporter permease subunit GldF [unclassified Siphonobacter]MDQ1087592.1 ABC-2 type transport system permease protein [Siphonobacter sp. SORGH_AS_1065]MDR6193743.1 ABC-2 type transport system permease protein [Siphonobacter sp. SORGH_AS_0500]PKK37924.1 gliding motility-associated ABC transporter permease subunit GldF [Siphonobacter sp. SORGH_AS_0500]
MFTIFKKEVHSFLSSLVGYVVMAVFLMAMGLLVWVFPDTSVLEGGYADMASFFNLAPYVFLFLIPAITMRSIAEERKIGTLELLFTKPVTEWQVVGGKFLAACFLLFLTLLPTLLYYFSVYQLGNPVGNIDTASVQGSYLGLFLLGCVFAAIGLFTSSLTDNQIVAFLLGVFISFILYVGFSSIAGLELWNGAAYWLGWLGLDTQYNALGRGLIDSRNVIYFLSLVLLALSATRWKLTQRN